MKNSVRFLVIAFVTLLIVACAYFGWDYIALNPIDKKSEQQNATAKQQTTRKSAFASYGIAVVDMKRVASGSKAGKSIEKQIMDINDQSKKDLVDLESKIKSMESTKKTEEDNKKIEDLHLILYDMIRDKRLQISTAYKAAIAQLEERIRESIAEISKQGKIKLVITADAVVHFMPPVRDITDDVVKFLDKVCEEIEVRFKQNGGF